MDREAKITYSIILTLIIILSAVAYFLQDSLSLPQVQITEETNTVKKVVSSKTRDPISGSSTIALPEKITSATITTSKGDIEITFATNTPLAVKNFARLALEGFYDGTRFHRVMRDFMIQGGDPLSKDTANKAIWGQGGPGYAFKDEFHKNDGFPQGTLAMANSGPNTNGSQFFIVTSITGAPWLIGKHTVFGHVTKGLDVALKINEVETTDSNAKNIPLEDILIEKIEIK